MKFTYKAQKADGTFYEDNKEATDKFALARELRATGETLIHTTEVATVSRISFNIKRLFPFLSRVSIHEKVIFARNLAGMLSAGLTVSRALNVLERQTRSAKFRAVITGLSNRINTGESLSQSCSFFPGVFPPIFISMVKAGEEGGTLGTSLLAVSEQLDRSYTLQRKVKGALMYPAVIVAVMLLVGSVLFIYVVPKLTSSFKEFNVDLPMSTKVVIFVSDFMQVHLFVGLALIVGLFVGGVAVAKSARGKRIIDSVLLRIPVMSAIVKEANAARASQTLSALLSSGVPVVRALEITADVLPNHYYRDVLFLARTAIEKGEPMSSIFRAHEDIFPPFLSEMVAVGEETGKLSHMLQETGTFFEQEVDQKTKNISTLIEPVLMVVVGAVVGFFAVAMISPMYSLMNTI